MSFLESVFSWSTAYWLLLILYILCCGILITVVLLQKGKGSGFAGAFGVGGGSDAVFGPRASKSLPARLTTIMASIFLFLAFALSLIEGKQSRGVAPEKISETQSQEDDLSGLESSGLGLGDAAKDMPAAPAPKESGAPTAEAPAAPKSDSPAPAPTADAPAAPAPAAPSEPGTPSAN